MTYLQGTKPVVLATVDVDEPRASPMDSLFIHGRFTMSTGRRATKVRHMRANPACSAVLDVVCFRLNPTTMWAYAFDPTQFPER